MCVGMMILFGPPTVGLAGYWLALQGQCVALRRWRLPAAPERTFASNAMSAGALIGTYQLQVQDLSPRPTPPYPALPHPTPTLPQPYPNPTPPYPKLRAMVRHFDEGGALSLSWKQGADSLGKPFELKTWGQFYRACGPPVFARVAAMMASCYLAGWASISVRAIAAGRAQREKK